MADFQACVNFVISNEIIDDRHTLSRNPKDPGGITNWGISLRFLREVNEDTLKRIGIFESVTEKTIEDLTRDQAEKLYYSEFWRNAPFEKVMNGMICRYFFDMAINHGLSNAVKIIQRACCAAQQKKDYLRIDGICGSLTLQAINQTSFKLVPSLISERWAFMRAITVKNPETEVFLDGWTTRAFNF